MDGQMKTLGLLAATASIALMSGCGSSNDDVPEGKFHIEVQSIVEGAYAECTQLNLTLRGSKTVHLGQPGDNETIGVSTDGDWSCRIVALATLMECDDGAKVVWLHQIQKDGQVAGSPDTINVEDAYSRGQTLQELLRITVTTGDYPLGQEIDVAEFGESILKLKVE